MECISAFCSFYIRGGGSEKAKLPSYGSGGWSHPTLGFRHSRLFCLGLWTGILGCAARNMLMQENSMGPELGGGVPCMPPAAASDVSFAL